MATPLLQNCQKQRSFGETGEFQEDILDPRIQTELEKLNSAADNINRLELALDEARANFRQNLTESTQQLNALVKKLGSCIEKARPYYEARLRLKEAQVETQNATLKFDRACSQLMAAKEMVFLAEQGYFKKGQPFDPAWQEMLNHATTRVNEAETERLESELEHQQTAGLFNEAEQLVKVLQKDLKRVITKSRPYFELKAKFHQRMEDCKKYVTQLEQGVSSAKKSYADTLFRLEKISDEIHQLRAEAKLRQEMGDRGIGVGAETPSPPSEESDKSTLAAKEPCEKAVPQPGMTRDDVDQRECLNSFSDRDNNLYAGSGKPAAQTEVIQNTDSPGNDRQHLDKSLGIFCVSVEKAATVTENCTDVPHQPRHSTIRDKLEDTTVEYDPINDSIGYSSNKETTDLNGHLCYNDSNRNKRKSERGDQNKDQLASSENISCTELLVSEKCMPMFKDKTVTSMQQMKSPAMAGIGKSAMFNKVRNFEKTVTTRCATVVKTSMSSSVEKVADKEDVIRKTTKSVLEKNIQDVPERGEASPPENFSIALTLTSPDSEKSLAFSTAMSSPDSENNSEREHTMNTNAEVMERVQQTKDIARQRFLRLHRASHDNLLDEFSDTDSESIASVSMLDDEQVESLMQETSEYVDFLTKLDATNPVLVRRMSLPGKLNYLTNYVSAIAVDMTEVVRSHQYQANSVSELRSTGEIMNLPNQEQENCCTTEECREVATGRNN